MHEADVVAHDDRIGELFTAQFSGAAPINGGKRPRQGEAGKTAQANARTRHAQSKMDPQRKQLDEELTEACQAVFQTHFPQIKILEPRKNHTPPAARDSSVSSSQAHWPNALKARSLKSASALFAMVP